ncbi:hypothetical protein CROQUDRAFT_71226 [Cronartium quercuum f. sp. fusiforme G11]|uniref:NodB homology domain-containing protein n=1 Tax=Cronartium quercuum f. sp. fusiforme G11 TaxID=708437 RepID=A0A9P6TIL2_9BASI|nr:hypothetical protein CROQUDRAFT_71226 [Cronartium quercuum f. sp. fusiforme G11]
MEGLITCAKLVFILLSTQTWSWIASPTPTLKYIQPRSEALGTFLGSKRSPETLNNTSRVKVYKMCTMPNSFAQTYDDGPSEYSDELDKTLNSYKAKATYFLNGNNAGCIYDHASLLVERFRAGHLLGSHTWGHVLLSGASYGQIHIQLELLETAFIMILGVKPLWFRPPFGVYNDLVLEVLAERGYKGLVMWSKDTLDADSQRPSFEEIIEAYSNYPNQTNVLSHEIVETTVREVAPVVIPELKARGLKLVTISECLEISDNPRDWYQYIGPPTPRNESWTCVGTPGPGEFE